MLGSFLHYALQQGGVIAQAPLAFAICVIIAGGVIWLVVKAQYDERFDTQDAYIGFLNGQLAEYKDKLSGATPDQAASEMNELKVQLSRLTQWRDYHSDNRRLVGEGVSNLQSALASFPNDKKSGVVVASINASEPLQLAQDILDALKPVGICIEQTVIGQMQVASPDEVGVLVVVDDPQNPPASAKLMLAALSLAGVVAQFDQFDGSRIGDPFAIFVSFKPAATF